MRLLHFRNHSFINIHTSISISFLCSPSIVASLPFSPSYSFLICCRSLSSASWKECRIVWISSSEETTRKINVDFYDVSSLLNCY